MAPLAYLFLPRSDTPVDAAPSTEGAPPVNTNTQSPSSLNNEALAAAGIIVGTLLALAALAQLFFFVRKRRRRAREAAAAAAARGEKPRVAVPPPRWPEAAWVSFTPRAAVRGAAGVGFGEEGRTQPPRSLVLRAGERQPEFGLAASQASTLVSLPRAAPGLSADAHAPQTDSVDVDVDVDALPNPFADPPSATIDESQQALRRTTTVESGTASLGSELLPEYRSTASSQLGRRST